VTQVKVGCARGECAQPVLCGDPGAAQLL